MFWRYFSENLWPKIWTNPETHITNMNASDGITGVWGNRLMRARMRETEREIEREREKERRRKRERKL